MDGNITRIKIRALSAPRLAAAQNSSVISHECVCFIGSLLFLYRNRVDSIWDKL